MASFSWTLQLDFAWDFVLFGLGHDRLSDMTGVSRTYLDIGSFVIVIGLMTVCWTRMLQLIPVALFPNHEVVFHLQNLTYAIRTIESGKFDKRKSYKCAWVFPTLQSPFSWNRLAVNR